MKKDKSYYFIWFPVRLALGSIFVYSGLSKLAVPVAETRAIFYEYTFLPDFAVPWIALMFPWVEFFVGSFLFFGLFTRLAASVLLGFTFSFVVLLGAERLLGGHFPGDCGCFAGSWKLPTPVIFLMDILNFFLALKLVRLKSHLCSLDAFISSHIQGERRTLSTRSLTGIILALALAGIVLVAGIYHGKGKPTVQAPAEPVKVSFVKRMGASDATVEIVEFTDFECPACGAAHNVLKQIESQYAGKINVTFKHYPLQYHKSAMQAHRAAECANSQGKFWSFHDALYQSQREWVGKDPSVFFSYAEILGLDVPRFKDCLSGLEPDIAINAEVQEARKRQVNATPTFFINGERAVGLRELSSKGKEIIEHSLQQGIQHKKQGTEKS
ncbi:MAG: thioredoxin domain-containing protein [Candidatus Omnitrophota bacterium]|jgi:protein-disulfide isomerase